MFKLCYKSYDCKLSLKASKEFKKETGEDLAFTLSRIIEAWDDSIGSNSRQRLNSIYSACDTELAARALHALVNGDGGRIPLEEIEDALFRVGVFPNEVDDEWSLPWPIVLVKIAQDIERDFKEDLPEKKTDTAE